MDVRSSGWSSCFFEKIIMSSQKFVPKTVDPNDPAEREGWIEGRRALDEDSELRGAIDRLRGLIDARVGGPISVPTSEDEEKYRRGLREGLLGGIMPRLDGRVAPPTPPRSLKEELDGLPLGPDYNRTSKPRR